MIIKIIGRRFHLSEKAPFQTHTSCWLKEMVKVWKKNDVGFLSAPLLFPAPFTGFLSCYPIEARKRVWKKAKQSYSGRRKR